MTGSVFKEKVMSDLNMTIGKLIKLLPIYFGKHPCFQSLPVNVLTGNFLENNIVQKQFDMPYLLM